MSNRIPWYLLASMFAAILIIGTAGSMIINSQDGALNSSQKEVHQLHQEQNYTLRNETIALQVVQSFFSEYNNTTSFIGPMVNISSSQNLTLNQFVNYLDQNTTFLTQEVPDYVTIGPFDFNLYENYSQAVMEVYNYSMLHNGTSKLNNITIDALNSALTYEKASLGVLGGMVLVANVTGQNMTDNHLVRVLINEINSDLDQIGILQEKILFLQLEVKT